VRVKRYLVEDMSKVITHIRADLGPEAVILNSRQVKRDGLLGRWRSPVWEVLAAVDSDESGGIALGRVADRSQKAKPETANSSAASTVTSAHADEFRALRREIQSLRAAVDRLTRQSAIGPILQLPPLLQEMHQGLLDQRLLPEVATRVVLTVAETLSSQALSDRRAIQTQLVWQLSHLLPVKEPAQLRRNHPRILFIVGPTGVGKTTTIAKLAADYALRQQIPVSLATADTYRVAAIQQLETYGEILGLPVDVAYSPDELRALAEKQADGGIMLVDTPGRSPYNTTELSQLQSFLSAVPDKEVFLTLSACTKEPDLDQAINCFGRMPIDGLLFTKLDETEAVGPLFNTAYRTGLPLTYLTTGQKVPDDIEVARSDRVARWALGEGQIVENLAVQAA